MGSLSFTKKDKVRVPGSSFLNVVTIRYTGDPSHVSGMNEYISEWLSKWTTLHVHK